jgi:serine/threonine protein kinase
MVGEDTIKITDFGTAKILQYGTSQQTPRVMGTLGYISPEQIKGTAVDRRTDIFSLGVMVYEMTTGRRPFMGEDGATVLYKILNEQPTPPQDLDSAIHPGIGNVILRAMAKNPGDRYQSCRAFFADLQDYRTATASAKNLDKTVALSPELRKTVVMRAVPVKQKAPGLKWATPVYTPQVTSPTRPRASTVVRWTETLKLALRNRNTAWGIGLAVLAIVGVLAMKGSVWHDQATLEQNQPTLQNTSSSAVEAGSSVPYVSPTDPTIGTLAELAVPWSSKKFFFRRDLTSRYVPALVLRLPGKPAADNSYWAFGLDVPFTQCQYEYIGDLSRLSTAYAFAASHPMVGNPCTHSVLDPMQMKEVPGNYLVRGAIVRGWDPRPPYQIEVSVRGNEIRAIRME